MVDVGPVDKLILPLFEGIELCPEVGTEGVGAVGGPAGAVEQAVVAVILIEAGNCVRAVLNAEPLTHIDVLGEDAGLARDSIILLEQIRTIDKKRLKEKMGHLDEATMINVNSAIQVSFGLLGGGNEEG